MISFSLLDIVVVSILGLAMLRGFAIGLIRESFSIGALGAAFVTVRLFAAPSAGWLTAATQGQIGAAAAPWLTGIAIGIGTVAAVAFIGSWLRKGAHAAGLSWADRIGGSALGAAEGALVAGLIVMGTTYALGREHPAIDSARSVEAFDEARAFVLEQRDDLPAVAAPGKSPRDSTSSGR